MKKLTRYIDTETGICVEAINKIKAWHMARHVCYKLDIGVTDLRNMRELENLPMNLLQKSIFGLSGEKEIFNRDDEGRFSVNTSFIKGHVPVYFDCANSYFECVNRMVDYFEVCMGRPKSVMKDSLIAMGYPSIKLFSKYVGEYILSKSF